MILTITGPSGSSKTTLLEKLFQAQPIESTTTRAPRNSDQPREYRHVSSEEFEHLQRKGEFLWSVAVHGNHYGTTKVAVLKAFTSKKLWVAILTPDAVKTLHSYALAMGLTGQVRSVYLLIEDEEELRRRLTKRGDTAEEIERRITDYRSWNTWAQKTTLPLHITNAVQASDTIARAVVEYIDKPLPL